MRRRFVFALALALAASSARAQQPGDPAADLPAALAQETITVSSDYRGSAITVFGVNPDRRGRGDIVVVVRGPDDLATVMHKQRVFGVWANTSPVRFSEAPAFFAVLSNRPLRDIASPQAIWRYRLDPAASAQLASEVPAGADPSAYRNALVQLRRSEGLYQQHWGPPREGERAGLTLYQGGLFRAVVELPSNAPIAPYQADTYLFREGRLISRQQLTLDITRVGVERSIHDLANNMPLLYGLVTVMLALSAGYGAALLFRRT